MKDLEIKVLCECGKLEKIDLGKEELDWEIIESDEREMGIECLHEAVFDFECKKCHNIITLTLHIWEYPEGFCNMDEILVDGGELVEGRSLESFLGYEMDE